MKYRLGDLARISSSKRIYAKEYTTSGIPFYRGKEIIELSSGHLVSNKLFISKDRFNQIRSKYNDVPEKDDVLITAVGTIGETYLVKSRDLPFYFKDGNLIKLSKWNRQIVSPEYMYYWLNSYAGKMAIKKITIGSTQQAITIGELSDIELDLPPINEQGKIAQRLSILDVKIDNNKHINANLDELLSAIYNHLVGDKNHNAKLSDICFISNRKISVSDLQLNNYWSNTNLLPDKAGAKIADKLPKAKNVNKVEAGDILFGNIRPYFKKIMYASYNGGASTDVVCFHPNNSAISEFLYSIIYSDKFISSVVRSAKGTKMPRGDKKQMMSYKVYLPTKEEIESFHKQANVILQQKQSNNVENEHLQELKKILLKRLF